MRRLTGGLVLTVAMALAAVGCDSTPEPPTTPTTPNVPVTEIFSGTVNTNGGVTFSFRATAEGIVTASLRTLTPDSTILIGLAMGTWNGVTCQLTLVNDQATQGIAVTGATSDAGTLCVRIYDVGQITQPQTFEIVVVHP